MTTRYCLPRVQGRGAGLGNELIPWARAFLASQILGAKCLTPAFGVNTRRYWRHFGTPRYDFVVNRALEKVLPVVQYTESDYLRHGGGDFVNAFAPFAEENRLHARDYYVLATEGMWGGYRHIAAARDFVYSTLYQSQFAARNLLTIQSRLDSAKVTVAMHVRLGDFSAAPSELSGYRGKFNLALPLQWYRNIAINIQRHLGDAVQFLIVSDGRPEQLQPLLTGLNAICTIDIPDSDCSDLLALANADLLVCSVSSFSTTAAFLSRAPYLWFEPNLQVHPEGFYSIWGHEAVQQTNGSATLQAIQLLAKNRTHPTSPRGVSVGIEGILDVELLNAVLSRKKSMGLDADLVHYGVTPVKSRPLATVQAP